LQVLDRAGGFPLGIMHDWAYDECKQQLQLGDQIIFYTDGVTEASNPEGKQFGTDRLDRVLENCSLQASALLKTVLRSVEDFANGNPADDDRTVIVARVM